MEEFEPKKNKLEIPNMVLIRKVIDGLRDLGASYHEGYNLVEIMDLRLNKKLTLEAIGEMLGINKERVRQKQLLALRILWSAGKITMDESDAIETFLRDWRREKKLQN